MMGWVIFRANTFKAAGDYFHALFVPGHLPAAQPLARYTTNEVLSVVVLGILFSGPLWDWIKTKCARLSQASPAICRPVLTASGLILEILLIVALLLISSAWLAGGTYNPFIYFRF
jgi:alginate O-acetyltransferase complex protein AlgI